MTFDYMFNTVFPLLGEFFGKLAAIASAPFYKVVDLVLPVSASSIPYVNVFTGQSGAIPGFNFFPGLSNVFGFFNNLLDIFSQVLGFREMPFILGLMVFFASSVLVFIAIRIIRSWVIKIIW